MKKQPLRVGFDLDGVLLYNPARIVRPLIIFFKRLFLKKEINRFHYPKTRIQKFFWFFLHKSSIFIAPGLNDIKKLVKEKKISAYIITARYEFLKDDFYHWLDKIEAKKYFTGYYFNNNNEQPHIFKARKIKELRLDLFIEDNWDIVNYLSKKTDTKIYWIYNLLDRNIKYKFKYSSLQQVVSTIKKNLLQVL